jgi:hypothetical protein
MEEKIETLWISSADGWSNLIEDMRLVKDEKIY